MSSAIVDYFTQRAWAMDEAVLRSMAAVIDRHIRGDRLSDSEIAAVVARKAGGERDLEIVGDSIAVIPIQGVIARHARQVNGASQPRGSSVETIRAQFQAAMADDRIKGIVMPVNSPGGSVDGIADLADVIFDARQSKDVVAVADGTMASAAYWLASQATTVYASRGSHVGSIGVYAAIEDDSVKAHVEGVKVHVVRSGEYKGAGAAGTPITDGQLGEIRRTVDEYFGQFVSDISRGRGKTEEAIRRSADGRIFSAKEARDRELIDGTKTVDAVIRAMVKSFAAKTAATQTGAMVAPATGVAEAAAAETAGQNDASLEGNTMTVDNDAIDAAIKAERERVQLVLEHCPAADTELRDRLIDSGATQLEVLKACNQALAKRMASGLVSLRQTASEPVGQLTPKPIAIVEAAAAPLDDAAAWQAMTPAEQADWYSFETFKYHRGKGKGAN